MKAKFEKVNQEFACVFHKGKAYIAFLSRPFGKSNTPTFKLIQNIFEEHKDLSFFILRQRIFTSLERNELDAGLVKVTAKRIQFATSIQDPEFQNRLHESTEVIIVAEAQKSFHSKFFQPVSPEKIGQKIDSIQEGFQFLENLVQSHHPEDFKARDRHDRNREVGAMLLDPENRILAYAINSSAINKTLHAEINLIQEYIKKTKASLPNGSQLLVTHKPCKMCAGAIFQAAENPKELKIYYKAEVFGAHSTATVLDKYQLNKKFEI